MSDGELYQCSSDDEFQEKNYVDTLKWRASKPPEEVFKDSDLNKEWGYDIIGEEVDENGKAMFEVRWDDWARENGTKTTWNSPSTINHDHWKREQRKIRRDAARESLQIDVISTTDIHNMATYLAHQAYEEKMKKSEAMPQSNLFSELVKIQAKHQQQVEIPCNTSRAPRNNQRASTRQKSEISLANSGRGASTSTRLTTWGSQSNISSISATSTKSLKSRSATIENLPATHSSVSSTKAAVQKNDHLYPLKRARTKQTIQSGSEDEIGMTSIRPSSSLEKRTPKRRRLSNDRCSPAAQRSQLEKEWTKIAAQDKGAPIYFVNTVDSEPVPPLPAGFLYLESRYQFSSGVPRPSQMEGFLVKCSSSHCIAVASCECQVASAFVDETGTPMLAYTPDGYFAFNVPKGTEVVECNKLCGCSLKTCRNRVSQRPRDVPIEIFKTESRGWGVRPLVDVRRGKVLSLYTGLVIPREAAHSLPDHVNSDYVFDLDGDENGEGNPLHHPLFSVDSKSCGNWTRFINHSCSPNVQIYLVARDVPPANGLPFIAFVALENIPAKTEFTFDYDPRVAERIMLARKAKKKAILPDGAKICTCGAKACRGILT